MKINKKNIIIAVVYVICFIMLGVGSQGIKQSNTGFKILGYVLVVASIVISLICSCFYKAQNTDKSNADKEEESNKPSPKSNKPKVSNVKFNEDGTISSICHEDIITLNIWGQMREIKVSSQRILYDDKIPEDKKDNTKLNESELQELNWLIQSNIINSEKVKNLFLQYVNHRIELWGGDEDKVTSIMPPVVELNEIVIDSSDFAEDKVIAFCGETTCDSEHGIAITFVNHEIDGLGDYMSFENCGDNFTGDDV